METRYTIRPREAASESIQAYILENQLCAGDRLPSEREMCSMWNLNRSTLRSALARFVRSGILEVRQGSGIFYIGPKYQRKLQGLKSFKAETTLQARAHESRLLSLEKLECDKRLSRVFQTILGTPLWHLSRLRLAEGIPLEIESSYFLVDRFPGIDRYDFVHDSLYRVFEEEYGIIPTQGDETITATRAGAEAALLAIPDEAPIFRIESRTYNQYGQFLEYCRAVARPDRVQLISHMDRISGEEGGL